MDTYQEFCRLRDLFTPGAIAPKHTEAEAFAMAAAQLAVPDGYKLAPLEPTPEIIAGAAVAIWPTASPADIALARLAAPIVLMQMDMVPGTTVDAVAGMLATMAPAYRAMLAAAPIPLATGQHPDDIAVDRFAFVMKQKLAVARANGRHGWDDPELCSVEALSDMLHDLVAKGDPVDVANFCMMLKHHNAKIMPPHSWRDAPLVGTVLACPFCGSNNISTGEMLSQGDDGDYAQSMCRNCEALGPAAKLIDGDPDYGDTKSTEAWNRRAKAAQEDASKANFWFDCLYECSKLLDLDENTPIPSGVVAGVKRLVANQQSQTGDGLRYPDTLTPNLTEVLGMMNFHAVPIAHIFRAAGAAIPEKTENEQAFVLDFLIRLVIKYGDGWKSMANAEIGQAKLQATAKHEQ